MSKILETIARENFRNSGYISQPSRERPVRWTFSAPPRSPSFTTDTVRDAQLRRARAVAREEEKLSSLQFILNAFLRRR